MWGPCRPTRTRAVKHLGRPGHSQKKGYCDDMLAMKVRASINIESRIDMNELVEFMIHNIHKRPYFHTISIRNPSLQRTHGIDPTHAAAGGDLASVIRETLDSNQMLPHLWVQEAALQVRPEPGRDFFHTLSGVTWRFASKEILSP